MGITCGHCGRFCVPADEYTPFGGVTDLEPPDEVYLCAGCAAAEEEELVRMYQGANIMCGNWQKSNAERRAAKRLGMVLAGPKGAAWSLFFAPDAIPDGYEAW